MKSEGRQSGAGAIDAPITFVSGLWKFHREPGPASRARSTPEHLFHYLIAGGYQLTTNRRTYRVKAGDVIYYYGSEEVECRWDSGPVDFYSLALQAPALAPLPLERRVFRGGERTGRLFVALHASYAQPESDPARVRFFGQLYQLLDRLGLRQPAAGGADRGTEGAEWGRLELALRRENRFRATLDELCARANCSRATLVRRCRQATGRSPQARLRELRLAEAQGLLRYSPLSLAEIAARLGFSRPHEFSREFGRHCGRPPSAWRNA